MGETQSDPPSRGPLRRSPDIRPPVPVETGFVELAGSRVAFASWRPGSGDGAGTVVLVHGGRAHSAWWHPIIAAGELSGHRLITLDLTGHGASGRRGSYAPELWADEVVAILDRFGGGQLVGHSMGGLVSVVAASRHPGSVRGLVLVDSRFSRPDPRSPTRPRGLPGRPLRPYPSREAAAAAFRLLPDQPIVNPAAFSYVAERSADVRDGVWRWKFDPGVARRFNDAMLLEHLSSVLCPVEIVHGANSPLVDADNVRLVESMLGRPIRATAVAEAHHHVVLDQPRTTGIAIREALDRMAQGSILARPLRSAPDRP